MVRSGCLFCLKLIYYVREQGITDIVEENEKATNPEQALQHKHLNRVKGLKIVSIFVKKAIANEN
jgi:hypothetical protein